MRETKPPFPPNARNDNRKSNSSSRASRPSGTSGDAVDTGSDGHDGDRSVCALLVGIDEATIDNIAAVLRLLGIEYQSVNSISQALNQVNLPQLDVVFVADALLQSELDHLSAKLTEVDASSSIIVVGRSANFTSAVEAMRNGAVDFLIRPIEPLSALPSVKRAIERARTNRRRHNKADRLKKICKRINTARLDVTNQVDTLCNDLVHAYQELADQISHVTTVTEFAAVIRQELDVEELLRTTLEYFLKKIGPMNAAVFLPSAGDEFTLGAYINYDCTRENAAFLLDHLADVVSPLMAEEDRLREFKSNAQLSTWMGNDAAWLSDTHFVTFSCRRDDECLAIFAIWRDIHSPFAQDMVSVLPAISEVFTRQLAHVIHVHHRHLPDLLDDEDDTYADFESDDNWKNGPSSKSSGFDPHSSPPPPPSSNHRHRDDEEDYDEEGDGDNFGMAA